MNCENCKYGKTTSPATFCQEVQSTPPVYANEGSPSIVIPWPPWRVILQNIGPATVYGSFDGKQDHFIVYGWDPSTEGPAGIGQIVLHRCPTADGIVRIWLRSPGGGCIFSAVAER